MTFYIIVPPKVTSFLTIKFIFVKYSGFYYFLMFMSVNKYKKLGLIFNLRFTIYDL